MTTQIEIAIEDAQTRLTDIWSALASGNRVTFTRNGSGVVELLPKSDVDASVFKEVVIQLAAENDTLMP